MPQEFQVVRCFSCQTFNSDIVKKKNDKWQCKMCGEKQSVKHVFCVFANAKDCREAVQELNCRRGQRDENHESVLVSDEPECNMNEIDMASKIVMVGNMSRWSKYLVNSTENEET